MYQANIKKKKIGKKMSLHFTKICSRHSKYIGNCAIYNNMMRMYIDIEIWTHTYTQKKIQFSSKERVTSKRLLTRCGMGVCYTNSPAMEFLGVLAVDNLFLSSRSLKVVVYDQASGINELYVGIPQDTFLSPAIFLLYISEPPTFRSYSIGEM